MDHRKHRIRIGHYPGATYSFRASFAFGRSSLLPHFRQRVARGAFRA